MLHVKLCAKYNIVPHFSPQSFDIPLPFYNEELRLRAAKLLPNYQKEIDKADLKPGPQT